jgi:adenylate kinase
MTTKKNPMKQYYILSGPPGSGKGTQADLIKKALGAPLIQVGTLLRREVKKRTAIGREVAPYLHKGVLAPWALVNDMMLKKLRSTKRSVIVLDGFPRQVSQARALAGYVKETKATLTVIELELSNKIIIQRIKGRRSCDCGATYHVEFNPPKKEGICDRCGRKLYVRNDSELAVVKRRLEVYRKQTVPAMKYLKKNLTCPYVIVHAQQPIKDVFREIKMAFSL